MKIRCIGKQAGETPAQFRLLWLIASGFKKPERHALGYLSLRG